MCSLPFSLLLIPYFLFTMAFNYSAYRLETVASLKILATETMPRNTVKLRIVD